MPTYLFNYSYLLSTSSYQRFYLLNRIVFQSTYIFICSICHLPIYFFFYFLLPPLGGLLSFWSVGMISQFLDNSQTVGLLERVISSLRGLYLNTGQHKHRKTHTHIKHSCPKWDSIPRSRPPSERRQHMLQTARLPWPVPIYLLCLFVYKPTSLYLPCTQLRNLYWLWTYLINSAFCLPICIQPTELSYEYQPTCSCL
jgi:hypothetical protein